jgi:excisionase family DNA binding protein
MTAKPIEQKEEGLLNAGQVAEEWNVKPRWPLMLAQQGKLPCVRLGRKCVRFRRADVDAFAAAKLSNGEVAK